MLQLTIELSGNSKDSDSLEVFDVDGSKFTPISIPGTYGGKIYSKFRSVYVEFKSDDVVVGNSDKGIFVKYSAIKTGKTPGCGDGKRGKYWDRTLKVEKEVGRKGKVFPLQRFQTTSLVGLAKSVLLLKGIFGIEESLFTLHFFFSSLA